jgi:DNA-binding CsgD family transcriptional regulator
MNTDYQRLTPKESEIFQLMVKHAGAYDCIAEELCVSIVTVRTHITNLFQKLHVRSKMELILLGLRKGLIYLDSDGETAKQTTTRSDEGSNAPVCIFV